MPFDIQSYGSWSDTGNPNAPWSLGVKSSIDSLATMKASGYLNLLAKGARVRIKDLIYLAASDGNVLVEVTAVSPDVTVVDAITVGTDIPLADGTFLVGDAAGQAASVSLSGDATVTNTGVLTVADGVIDGINVAEVADANATAGILVVHTINTPGGATGDTNLIVTHPFRVIDVVVQNNAIGTTGDQLYVKNGNSGNIITNAIDISGADNTIARTGEVIDLEARIAGAGTLRASQVDGGGADSPPLTVTVIGVRVA